MWKYKYPGDSFLVQNSREYERTSFKNESFEEREGGENVQLNILYASHPSYIFLIPAIDRTRLPSLTWYDTVDLGSHILAPEGFVMLEYCRLLE